MRYKHCLALHLGFVGLHVSLYKQSSLDIGGLLHMLSNIIKRQCVLLEPLELSFRSFSGAVLDWKCSPINSPMQSVKSMTLSLWSFRTSCSDTTSSLLPSWSTIAKWSVLQSLLTSPSKLLNLRTD